MSNKIQNNNQNKQRDYDKNPIVVIDRMSEISFWFFMFLTLIPLAVINLWLYYSGKEIDWTHISISLIILYIPTYYFLKSRIANLRTISFYNYKIIRRWDDDLLELKWKDIINVKKSFIDFYDKSQTLDELRKKTFSFLLIPYFILIAHPYLILIKYFYKLAKGFSYRKVYDTIIFFSEDNLMIALFVPDKETYLEIKDYIYQKKYNIEELSIFYSTSYAIDELTYYFNKKVVL